MYHCTLPTDIRLTLRRAAAKRSPARTGRQDCAGDGTSGGFREVRGAIAIQCTSHFCKLLLLFWCIVSKPVLFQPPLRSTSLEHDSEVGQTKGAASSYAVPLLTNAFRWLARKVMMPTRSPPQIAARRRKGLKWPRETTRTRVEPASRPRDSRRRDACCEVYYHYSCYSYYHHYY